MSFASRIKIDPSNSRCRESTINAEISVPVKTILIKLISMGIVWSVPFIDKGSLS